MIKAGHRAAAVERGKRVRFSEEVHRGQMGFANCLVMEVEKGQAKYSSTFCCCWKSMLITWES